MAHRILLGTSNYLSPEAGEGSAFSPSILSLNSKSKLLHSVVDILNICQYRLFPCLDPHDSILLRKLTTILWNTQHNILCMTDQFVFHTTFRIYRGRWHKGLDWNSKVMNFLLCQFVCLFVVSVAVLFLLLLSLLQTWVLLYNDHKAMICPVSYKKIISIIIIKLIIMVIILPPLIIIIISVIIIIMMMMIRNYIAQIT